VPSAMLPGPHWSSPLAIAFCGPGWHQTASAATSVKHTSLFEYIYVLRLVELDSSDGAALRNEGRKKAEPAGQREGVCFAREARMLHFNMY